MKLYFRLKDMKPFEYHCACETIIVLKFTCYVYIFVHINF